MNPHDSSSKAGFTLIELLVVISIIALLSSIILASLSSARQKGATAAGLQFSSYNYNAFGADALAYFNFDGATTTNIPNLGLASLTATIQSGVSFPTDTSLHSTGSNAYISNGVTTFHPIKWIETGSSINNAFATSFNYTFSLWYKPDPNYSCNNSICTLISDTGINGDNHAGINLRHSGSTVTSIDGVIAAGSNVDHEDHSAIYATTLSPNVWTNIAFTVHNNNDGTVIGKLYVNGSQVASTGNVPLPSYAYSATGLEIGGLCCSNPANLWDSFGYYDDVAFYSQSLVSADIKNIYALEAPAHGIAVK